MTDYRGRHAAPGPDEDGKTVRLDQVGTADDTVFLRAMSRGIPSVTGARTPTAICRLPMHALTPKRW